ncbi:hypothetical protein KIN34_04690 [Cellulomonas sp. DKR-3]|uniref:Uncharacterized protein n=1 Tax=Cellulomonas fulva TaxID=2835530 RepID=A0ABS5TWW4_9CELL|nr:hypothetical protein [Cellulomonas fulva]MBT0993582.1 hypothetical protein [Cellulomonas fulva]
MDQTGFPAESSASTPATSPLARAQAWAALAARQGVLDRIPAQRERAAA